MRKALLVVALGLVLLLTVSCAGGGAPGGGSGANTISTTMTEMKFDPSTWSIKAGQQYTISAKNAGSVVHDWVVRGQEATTTVEVQPGQTGTKSFTIASAGTYEVYCSQPGHEAAGMKGTLTVTQ